MNHLSHHDIQLHVFVWHTFVQYICQTSHA